VAATKIAKTKIVIRSDSIIYENTFNYSAINSAVSKTQLSEQTFDNWHFEGILLRKSYPCYFSYPFLV